MINANVAKVSTNFLILTNLCLNLQADLRYGDALATREIGWGAMEFGMRML